MSQTSPTNYHFFEFLEPILSYSLKNAGETSSNVGMCGLLEAQNGFNTPNVSLSLLSHHEGVLQATRNAWGEVSP